MKQAASLPGCIFVGHTAGPFSCAHTWKSGTPPRARLHLRPAAAVDHAAVLHRLAQHAQRVVQRPLRLVEHVVAWWVGEGQRNNNYEWTEGCRAVCSWGDVFGATAAPTRPHTPMPRSDSLCASCPRRSTTATSTARWTQSTPSVPPAHLRRAAQWCRPRWARSRRSGSCGLLPPAGVVQRWGQLVRSGGLRAGEEQQGKWIMRSPPSCTRPEKCVGQLSTRPAEGPPQNAWRGWFPVDRQPDAAHGNNRCCRQHHRWRQQQQAEAWQAQVATAQQHGQQHAAAAQTAACHPPSSPRSQRSGPAWRWRDHQRWTQSRRLRARLRGGSHVARGVEREAGGWGGGGGDSQQGTHTARACTALHRSTGAW